MNDHQAIDLLEELVRVPSVSREEGQAVELLVERMNQAGFRASVDEAGNAVGRIGDEGPRVALLGHIDTVPGYVPVGREDGRLYGRGAVDAKGCLAAFAAAAARAATSGELACRVELIACVEEEVASSRGARYRATQPAPDACIIGEPSGSGAVTVGYKGFLRARLTREEDIAHTAAEAPGVAALACRQWTEIEDGANHFNGGRDALFDQLLLHLSKVDVQSDGLRERAELDVRLRLPPDLGPEAAVRWLAGRSPGWLLSEEGGLPAWSGPRTSPVARAVGRAISVAGNRARYQRKTGTADMNVVAPAWGCPCVAYGPGDSALDHAPNEYLEIEELFRSISVLEHVLGPSGLAPLLAPREGARQDARQDPREGVARPLSSGSSAD